MNTQIIKTRKASINKQTLVRILALMTGLVVSVMYGFYIAGVLQLQYALDSGDINSYVDYFDDTQRLFSEVSFGTDYVFRIAVLVLTDIYDLTTIELLSYMAFTIATILFFIYSTNIRSALYLFPILPLLLMVFFTPNIQFLFSSGIRSGIAFTLLLLAFIYFKGLIRYIFFLLAVVIHWSMLPIIALYFGFYILNNERVKISFAPTLILLILGSTLIAVMGSQLHSLSVVASSIFYVFIVFYVALLVIFINKKAVKNVYGFISVGLMCIYLAGVAIGGDFIRYVGNGILMYLLFLISEGEPRTIYLFSVGYAPFFVLTLFYAISNLGL